MQQRKLAAIMFTDIVGYTSLMGSDEKKAFEFIRKNRRIHWRLIKKYKGRLLKEMGDGILASFSSSIDAIKCALSIQNAVKELDIPLRIGIHQGDVIFEKKDVLGDGVNIASRIQSIADTHGITISETIYKDIKNQKGLGTEFLGNKTLKGIDSPVGVYKVSIFEEGFLDYIIDTGELVKPFSSRRVPLIVGILFIALIVYAGYYFLSRNTEEFSDSNKSILVLPFDNYTGTDTLEYFVAGMHSSLIGDIGKISSLQVKSKTTSNAYKDVEKSIPEIAEELGVNIIIETSVMCLGDSICLQVKVISPFPEEKTLWVEDFKEEKSQILSLYNRVTKEVSKEINIILTPREEKVFSESRTVDNEVYDLYMRSHVYWDQLSKEALNRAKEYLTLAISKDPDWAPLYAGLAKVWVGLAQMGHVSPEIALPFIYENLNSAMELDPNYLDSRFTNAVIGVWIEWDWAKGENEFLAALEINPNDVMSRIYFSHLLMILGQLDEALEQGKIAMELDPLNPLIQALYSVVLTDAGNYQEAMTLCEKALLSDPGNFFAAFILEVAAINNNDYEMAFNIGMQIVTLDDDVKNAIAKIYKEQGYQVAFNATIDSLEERSKENYVLPIDMAWRYSRLENADKVMEWLEKGYEVHDQNMPYIYANYGDLEFIKDDPRFIELLRKMNLPH